MHATPVTQPEQSFLPCRLCFFRFTVPAWARLVVSPTPTQTPTRLLLEFGQSTSSLVIKTAGFLIMQQTKTHAMWWLRARAGPSGSLENYPSFTLSVVEKRVP